MATIPENDTIVAALTPICHAYKAQGNIHKHKAYRVAIDAIKGFPRPITSADDIKSLPGIGKAMVEKVREILATGGLAQQKEVAADPITTALELFTAVHGVGPVLAAKLVHEHGLRTLADLENAPIQLPAQVRIGLKHHADTQKRIPFEEIEVHLAYVRQWLAEDPALDGVVAVVCGSHRRLRPTSGDIDILLTHPDTHSATEGATYVYLERIIRCLRARKYVFDALAEGQHKFMGYCRLPNVSDAPPPTTRRLDLRFVPYDSFYPAVLYFTGSDMFNIQMRAHALKMGYTLNEYHLYKLIGPEGAPTGKEKVEVNSEKEIFDVLGMKYVLPPQRERSV